MPEQHAINFSREAFLHPVNLVFLLGIVLSAYASAGWVPWMPTIIVTVGLGIELLYLGTIPRHHLFRDYIIKRHQADQYNPGYEKQYFDELETLQQKQFLALKRMQKKIRANFERIPESSRPLVDHLMRRLDDLTNDYLHQLVLLERFEEYLDNTSPESLSVEIRALEKEMASVTSERLLEVMSRRREILKKRRDKHRSAREKAQICSSQLDTVADIFCYVYEKSITFGNGDSHNLQLDLLMSELEETAAMIQDIEDDLPPTYTALRNMENQDS